jgi:hypothetical protein
MFYKTGVDIASTKSMWHFLKNHFTYWIMNSWNGLESIAHNVKVYNLGLEGDYSAVVRYLYDEADCAGLQLSIDDEIKAFEEKYPWTQVFFNGRSGGYLVLSTKDRTGSVLPDCVTEYDSYEDFKEDVKSGWNGYKVTDFDRDLRDAVEIVREFDKLCDRLRDIVNEYSLRSFDADKLAAAVEAFNFAYGDDLDSLGLDGPVFEEATGKVELNCLTKYLAYMHCFLNCLGEDRKRIATNDTHLWLKEV